MADKYLITTAQSSVKPNTALLKSMLSYAKREKAELIVLPTIGQNAREDIDELDEKIKELNVVMTMKERG